jgi:hypothetical protein
MTGTHHHAQLLLVEMGSCEHFFFFFFYQGWSWVQYFFRSASWVAGIISVSHCTQLIYTVFNFHSILEGKTVYLHLQKKLGLRGGKELSCPHALS